MKEDRIKNLISVLSCRLAIQRNSIQLGEALVGLEFIVGEFEYEHVLPWSLLIEEETSAI